MDTSRPTASVSSSSLPLLPIGPLMELQLPCSQKRQVTESSNKEGHRGSRSRGSNRQLYEQIHITKHKYFFSYQRLLVGLQTDSRQRAGSTTACVTKGTSVTRIWWNAATGTTGSEGEQGERTCRALWCRWSEHCVHNY